MRRARDAWTPGLRRVALFLALVLPLVAGASEEKPAETEEKGAHEAAEGEKPAAEAGDAKDASAPPPSMAVGVVVETADGDRWDPATPLDDTTRLRLFQQLAARSKALKAREADLERREQRLAQMQGELEKRFRALRMLEDALSAKAPATPASAAAPPPPSQPEIEAENVEQLAAVFEKMKPDAASRVVPSMSPDLAVAVLSRVKDRQAAKILGALEPGLAARLSARMAMKQEARAPAP